MSSSAAALPPTFVRVGVMYKVPCSKAPVVLSTTGGKLKVSPKKILEN